MGSFVPVRLRQRELMATDYSQRCGRSESDEIAKAPVIKADVGLDGAHRRTNRGDMRNRACRIGLRDGSVFSVTLRAYARSSATSLLSRYKLRGRGSRPVHNRLQS